MLLICAGIVPALRAGLLTGKTCTAPRTHLQMFRQEAPNVNWIERRWCNDGKIWTSGIGMNGLDAVRQFMLETWGNDGKPSLCRMMLQMGGMPMRSVLYDEEDQIWQRT